MEDYLVRALAREAGVRVIVSANTGLALEATDRHGTLPTATIALAHGLTGAALMGALLKVRQRIAMKFEGSGPLQKILVESDNNGRLRGYVSQPMIDLPDLGPEQIAAALGDTGLLTVVKDTGMPELSESTVPLGSGNIAAELTFSSTNQSKSHPSLISATRWMMKVACKPWAACSFKPCRLMNPTSCSSCAKTFRNYHPWPI